MNSSFVTKFNTNKYYVAGINIRHTKSDKKNWVLTDPPICQITYEGQKILADFYETNYLQTSNRKIIVPVSDEESTILLMQCLQDDACTMTGFMFIAFGQHSEDSHPHPTPIILEKKDGEAHLFVSDSQDIGEMVCALLAELSKKHQLKYQIHLCFSNQDKFHPKDKDEGRVVRQADYGLCQSEAMYYIQRALRLPSMFDHVEFVPKDQCKTWSMFYEPADLALTTQLSNYLAINKINETQTLKVYKKNQKTFFQKVGEKQRIERVNESDPQEVREFYERTFLRNINQKHVQIIDEVLAKRRFALANMESSVVCIEASHTAIDQQSRFRFYQELAPTKKILYAKMGKLTYSIDISKLTPDISFDEFTEVLDRSLGIDSNYTVSILDCGKKAKSINQLFLFHETNKIDDELRFIPTYKMTK